MRGGFQPPSWTAASAGALGWWGPDLPSAGVTLRASCVRGKSPPWRAGLSPEGIPRTVSVQGMGYRGTFLLFMYLCISFSCGGTIC